MKSGVHWSSWSDLKLNLLWIYSGAIPPTGKGRRDALGNPAWWLRKGQAKITSAQGTFHAEAGQWIIPHPDEREQWFSRDAELVSIRFLAQWPDGQSVLATDLPIVFNECDTTELNQLTLDLAETVNTRFHGESYLEFSSVELKFNEALQLQLLFYRWFEILLDTLKGAAVHPIIEEKTDHRLETALHLIRGLIPGRAYNAKDIAQKSGMSVSHYHRMMKKSLLRSGHDLYQEWRLKHARHQLMTSDKQITQIGFEMGFSAPSHFIHWFRKHTGQTPLKFRNQNVELGNNKTSRL